MDLRQLEYFLAVVEHGGVHRAAAALRIAQPSLSQAIRKLERDLHSELFHRVGRGLVLAPAGEALVGPARQMLRLRNAAHEAVREVRDVEGGRVDVASLADLSADPTAIWVAQFRVANPRVSARVEERDRVAAVAELVTSGECEIGVSVLPLPHEGLTGEHLLVQRFVLIAPPGTDDAFPPTVPLGALEGVPLVLGERTSTTREWIESTLRSCGVEPRVSVEVPQRGVVVPMVVDGAGIAIVPLRAALDAHHRGVVIREIDPPLHRNIGAIHRPGSLTPAARVFLEHTRDRVSSWERAIARRTAEGAGPIEAAASTDRAVRDRQRREFARRSPVARLTRTDR